MRPFSFVVMLGAAVMQTFSAVVMVGTAAMQSFSVMVAAGSAAMHGWICSDAELGCSDAGLSGSAAPIFCMRAEFGDVVAGVGVQ
jgi:hypothetical protein